MKWPLSIILFAWLFGCSCLLSLALAYASARSTHFNLPLSAEAADTLAARILWVRLAGLGFAVWLMGMIVLGRSRIARRALVARWILAVATSIVFLRSTGIVTAEPRSDATMLMASAVQLTMEAMAILLLYGVNASSWFEREAFS